MYLISRFSGPCEGLKIELVASHHCTNKRARGRPDEHIGFVGVPASSHLDRKKGAKVKGCTGDPATAQDKSYMAHRGSISGEGEWHRFWSVDDQ